MAKVSFTQNLQRYYPDLQTMEVKGHTIAELLDRINENHCGIKDYILDENGEVRSHVNIFIGTQMIKDRVNLSDQLNELDEVYIMQAISGG